MMYGVKKDSKKIKDSIVSLNILYNKIPKTKGCLENIVKENGCKAWCCHSQNPQVLYVEFLNTWNTVIKTWNDERLESLIEKCLRKYLFPDNDKGCIFIDPDTHKCVQHESRPFNCFLPNTWVFTESGPRYISEILAGDRVYGLDGKLYKVTATATKIHKGLIYGISQQGNHIKCYSTGNHKWLVSRQKDKRKQPDPKWIDSSLLVSKKGKIDGDYLIFPKNMNHCSPISGVRKLWIDFDCKQFVNGEVIDGRIYPFTTGKMFSDRERNSIPEKLEICSEFLFMLGIYLAEGYSSTMSSSFCMNIKEKQHLDRIQTYLSSLAIPSHYTTKKNNLILRVDSAIFARLMKQLCGGLAYDKKIHPKLFEYLSESEKLNIFKGWAIGDGRKPDKTVAESVTTISEKLAVQMQQILIENGIYPRVQKYHPSKRGFISYVIMINRSSLPNWNPIQGQGSKIMYDESYIYAPMDEIDIIEYEGPVVDIQVDEIESFVTTAGIAHNCRIYGIIPDEEFKPRYERLKVIYPETKDQCNLVSTVDGEKVTVKHTENWWLEANAIEMSIGVSKELINDSSQGSYRTYHDHFLIQMLGEQGMEQISNLRVNGTKENKETTISNIMSAIRKYKESVNEKGNASS